jgi:regulator of ribonuclease activity A
LQIACHAFINLLLPIFHETNFFKVLVVDGGGSMRRALLGDNVAATALKNNWSGVIIHGCVRDIAELEKINIGIKALGSIPRKTEKKNVGSRDIPVTFSGVTFRPNEYVYADRDGIVVSDKKLILEGKL